MNSKIMGGVLLVVGTTIGAGMLALPIATAQLGFWGSLLLLVGSWLVMTTCAFLFLEVTLWLPPNTNLISMAGATLGKTGQAIAWMVYLLLLYSILSAYIAGGGDLFHFLLASFGIQLSSVSAAVLFTLFLGSVVYLGIRIVDYVNRGLMFGKMGSLVLLVLLIMPFVTMTNLGNGEFKHIIAPTSISVTIVAFTCAMIIPSLRTYFGNDIASLRKVIFLGTLIPLLCYIAWDMVIMGVIPLYGSPSLSKIMHSASSNSDLVVALTQLLQKDSVTMLAKFFTSICMATSFLSISLCLSDFLSDGFRVDKRGKGNFLIYGATFLPPLILVSYFPDAFLKGISYAGLCCFVLMMLFPPLMVWSGRYVRRLSTEAEATFQVVGGKALLVGVIIISLMMITFALQGII